MRQRELDFYESLNGLSARTIRNYQTSIRSSFIKKLLLKDFDTDNLFDVDNIESLWNLYTKVNLHPTNISNHRGYSAAIMKYIKFLNGGKKYGKRIDFKKPKGKRKKQTDMR